MSTPPKTASLLDSELSAQASACPPAHPTDSEQSTSAPPEPLSKEQMEQLFSQASMAIHELSFDRLSELLEQNPDLGRVRLHGETLLMEAAGSDCVRLAEILLPYSDIAAVSSRGLTALARSAHEAQPAMMAFLLKNGAPVSWAHPDGLDALSILAKAPWHAECVECARLLAPVSDAFRVREQGRGAFELAFNAGRHEIAKIIWESQTPQAQLKAGPRWLANILGELRRGSAFFVGNSQALGLLLDDMACVLPGAAELILEHAELSPRDLPRHFAQAEARALRVAMDPGPADAEAPARPKTSAPRL